MGSRRERVRGELTLATSVEVPADVTVRVGRAGFTAAFITNHAGIMDSHVERMSNMEAKGWARVRGQADSGTDLGEREFRVL